VLVGGVGKISVSIDPSNPLLFLVIPSQVFPALIGMEILLDLIFS
jgi:hypothetical protein